MRDVMIALLSVVCAGSPALAEPPIDAATRQQLEHYEVLTTSETESSIAETLPSGLKMGTAFGVFDATPEEIYCVITDYALWPEFLPRITATQVHGHLGPKRTRMTLWIKLPWPVSESWVTADYDEDPGGLGGVYRLQFREVAGTMRRYFGTIEIAPWPWPWPAGGDKTLVRYRLLAEPRFPLPKRYLTRKLRDVTSKWLHAVRQRVNALHEAGRLWPRSCP